MLSPYNHQIYVQTVKTKIDMYEIREKALIHKSQNLSPITYTTRQIEPDVLSLMPKFRNILERCTEIRRGYWEIYKEKDDIPE